MKTKGLLLLMFFIPFFLTAQDSVKVNKVTVNGYVKDMQSFIFKDFNSASDKLEYD